MSDNTTTLRVTTIDLNEYDRLKNDANSLRVTIGANEQLISNLRNEISKLQEQQPVVKVIHLNEKLGREYDDWNDDINTYTYYDQRKVEFVNLSEVTSLANSQAKAAVSEKISELESRVKIQEATISDLNDNISKLRNSARKERETLKEEYNESLNAKDKDIKKLKQAYKEDTEAYKETIKELKEEIQKVKDSKTDAEIEEKRNKEIKDLKTRIKDLESLVSELGKLNFFKRVFKFKTISAEKLAAQKELLKTEKAANAIGTTWVREGGKYRRYNRFEETVRAFTFW